MRQARHPRAPELPGTRTTRRERAHNASHHPSPLPSIAGDRRSADQLVPGGHAEAAERLGERRGALRRRARVSTAGAREASRELAVRRHGEHEAHVILGRVAEERLGLPGEVVRGRDGAIALRVERDPKQFDDELRAKA